MSSSDAKPTVELLDEHVERHGRAPRVLHIGNIANNAYLNARMLNAAGFDCDVICYDYYHIMGCPEWEDADFTDVIEDHFAPDWSAVDLHGFERPAWFAQGPMFECLDYLDARRSDEPGAEERFEAVRTGAPPETPPIPPPWRRGVARLGRFARARLAQLGLDASRRDAATDVAERPPLADVLARLQRAYVEAFPQRTDALSMDDIIGYASVLPRWRSVLRHYDAVVGYATDGVLPLLCGKTPYFAYEHGTIRNIPFEETAQGRLCALTYRSADGVFITNCDNITAAERLRLERFRFVPHPVNEAHAGEDVDDLRADLRRRLDADFVIFHPARQHWEARRHPDWEKGNDILIRGFASFVKDVAPRAGAVFVEWGQKLEESKALLAELGVADRVHWIPPQPNRQMIRYVLATEAVADQFYLGAFGSLTPKALMCSRPALLHLDESRHAWCFPELPPVLGGNTPEAVAEALGRLYTDAAWRAEVGEAGRRWYERYHSNAVITGVFAETLGARLLSGEGVG